MIEAREDKQSESFSQVSFTKIFENRAQKSPFLFHRKKSEKNFGRRGNLAGFSGFLYIEGNFS